VFHWLNFQVKRNSLTAQPPKSLRVFWLLLLFATIAYVAWAAALPSTPFLQLTDQATKIGALAALVLGVLLPRAADAMKLTPSE
jgi:hypothetical protein